MKIKIFSGYIDGYGSYDEEDKLNMFLNQGNVIVKDIKTSESTKDNNRFLTIVVLYNEI